MTDTNELAKGHCVPCEGGTPSLEAVEAARLQEQIDDEWTSDGTWLRREVQFKNFRDAFAFATRIVLLAESEGHHPDLEVGWGYVRVALTTHAAKGLTNNDFVMSAKIDRFARELPEFVK